MIVYQLITRRPNTGMEELTIRLNNLRRLVAVAKKAKAPQKLVAKRLGVDSSRFSQLCGPNPIRKILEPTARAFEKQLHRPRRWLDTERTEEELLAAWLNIDESSSNEEISEQENQSLFVQESSPKPYIQTRTISALTLAIEPLFEKADAELQEAIMALLMRYQNDKADGTRIAKAIKALLGIKDDADTTPR